MSIALSKTNKKASLTGPILDKGENKYILIKCIQNHTLFLNNLFLTKTVGSVDLKIPHANTITTPW